MLRPCRGASCLADSFVCYATIGVFAQKDPNIDDVKVHVFSNDVEVSTRSQQIRVETSLVVASLSYACPLLRFAPGRTCWNSWTCLHVCLQGATTLKLDHQFFQFNHHHPSDSSTSTSVTDSPSPTIIHATALAHHHSHDSSRTPWQSLSTTIRSVRAVSISYLRTTLLLWPELATPTDVS